MKEVKIKISTIVLSIVLIIVSAVAGIQGFMLKELHKQVDKDNTSQAQVSTNLTDGKNAYEATYSFNILDMLENEKRDYKLNDDFIVTFEMKKIETTPVDGFNTVSLTNTYNFYVNNKFITEDTIFDANETELKVVLWNGYLLYQNYGVTDIRSDITYAIDKNGDIVKEIRELDESDKGLVANEIWRYSDKLVVTGSRISHGYAVVSQGNPADGITLKALKTISKDAVVKAQYTYKLESNGKINFNNPKVATIQTFKQYVNENKNEIIAVIERNEKISKDEIEKVMKDYLEIN